MKLQEQIKYIIPSIFACLFIVLAEAGYYYLIFPFLLAANCFNILLGEFTNAEIRRELRYFYGNKRVNLLKRLSAVCLLAMIIWAVIFVDRKDPSCTYLVLIGLGTGCLTGCFIVTLAHDLLHSKKRADAAMSAALLTAAGIPHLAADHVFGHHRYIGLEKDPNTPRLNQDFYSYFFILMFSRIKESFMTQFGLPGYIRKKMLCLNLKMLILLASVWLLILLLASHPGKVLFFFILQGFVSYFLYELINYIQHYGLKREVEEEEVTQMLSWNCYYKYTNYILHLLPLHSLHHLPHNNRWVKEASLKEGPRMPYLYFIMIGMALVPPLWFGKMNKLAMHYNNKRYALKHAS